MTIIDARNGFRFVATTR